MTITGTDLANASAVDFGATPGAITADSSHIGHGHLTCRYGHGRHHRHQPRRDLGHVAADQFTYVERHTAAHAHRLSPSTGPVAGGTSVTSSGSNLEDATAVDFGPGNPGMITADYGHLVHRHLAGGNRDGRRHRDHAHAGPPPR